MRTRTPHDLIETLRRRIVVLDGAMGSLIQRLGFTEADFRGERFRDHPRELAGNNDLLVLTQPAAIRAIHEQYLAAGADIIETDTFNATAVSQADYGTEALVYEMNRAAAGLAREACDAWTRRTPERPRYVAGAIGPTNKTLSLGPRVEDPAYRAVSFDEVRDAYADQVRGLIDGGVDLLLVETIFDTLNAKAALFAIESVCAAKPARPPVMISATVTDLSGRTLSGQTLEAFWIAVEHARPLSVGLNCSFGARELRPFLAELAQIVPIFVSAYPNAGLPNAFGEYDERPEITAELIRGFAADGLVNIVGGCCGTIPDHIRAIDEAIQGLAPRRAPDAAGPGPQHRDAETGAPFARFSGMDPLVIRPDSNFQMIGERTNVTGSRRFARLIRSKQYGQALRVAAQQVAGGANMLDVNMDEGLLDSVHEMETFLKLIAGEPEIARLPIMVDSSRWDVLEAGLRCLQGKGVVNSLSLKDGEEEFLRRARLVRRYGAGVVVMAFDEQGQADNAARKVSILSRAYRLLTEEVGFAPEDIILDPAVLAVATGLEEHRDYALAFIEAVRLLKSACPGARISGGISNLSFAFRGNDQVREAMHAAFLYHAIAAGLDMGIVNAGQLAVYEEIPEELRERVEDVLLNRRADATERLIAFAATVKGEATRREADLAWRSEPLEERLRHGLLHGVLDYMEEDLTEARQRYERALHIIEGPLMDGMKHVGELFGRGMMFLPQVVKSARAMKHAVGILEPYLRAESEALDGPAQDASAQGASAQDVSTQDASAQGEEARDREKREQAAADRAAPGAGRGRMVIATVRGDVHDIGKNIVRVVLECNGYEVVDLGVMVPAERILDAAAEKRADIVGLSGLITPSLDEMVNVAREMARRGLACPLLIGGATTNRQHTAVKIAPVYDQPVVHVKDASLAVSVMGSLLHPEQREGFVRENRDLQETLRHKHAEHQARPLIPFAEAARNKLRLDWESAELPAPAFTGRRVVDNVAVEELIDYIDWTFFFIAWELKGRFPKILDHPEYGPAARDLYKDARAMLAEIVAGDALRARGVYGFWPAAGAGEDIVLYDEDGSGRERLRFNMLRQQEQKPSGGPHLCLADFVAPPESGRSDHVGAFAVTAGLGTRELAERYEHERDDYRAIMVRALADRLAEAFAELLHERARREWGYGRDENLSKEDLIAVRYRGIRPAFGYPACPDHSEKFKLFDLLDAPAVGITLTEHAAMVPAASVSGLYFSHPESRYYNVGRFGRDQVRAYASRKGMSISQVEQWLAPYLDYDPD